MLLSIFCQLFGLMLQARINLLVTLFLTLIILVGTSIMTPQFAIEAVCAFVAIKKMLTRPLFVAAICSGELQNDPGHF